MSIKNSMEKRNLKMKHNETDERQMQLEDSLVKIDINKRESWTCEIFF